MKIDKDSQQRLQELILVEDGNTEINEAYYEVHFLGVEIWSGGGPRKVVQGEAQAAATRFYNRLLATLREI